MWGQPACFNSFKQSRLRAEAPILQWSPTRLWREGAAESLFRAFHTLRRTAGPARVGIGSQEQLRFAYGIGVQRHLPLCERECRGE